MRGHRITRVLKFVLFALIAAAVLGFVVMRLWNWVMPPIFGLHAIGYWQALACLAVSAAASGALGRACTGGA